MLLHMKIGIAGVSMLMFGLIFGWVLFPIILKSQVHKEVRLKEGTQVRELWTKFPFFLEFRVWLFNITNPNEIKEGAKPIVQEVGPWFYEEWQEKVDIVDREEDDTVEYAIKNTYKFDPTKGLSGEEELIIPHTFILAMVYTVVREKPAMMPVIGKAIDSIFKKPDSVFYKVKAKDILFNGLPIDCTVTDFAGSAVCSMLKDAGLQEESENHYLFSLFGARNGTASKKRQRVLRGIKKQMQVGLVVEYDGKNNISTWDDEQCDKFVGTDGTVFHPFFKKDEDILAFSGDLCRTLPVYPEHIKQKTKGVKTYRYTAHLMDMEAHPEQKCYCEAEDNCLGKGLMDLFKCIGAPMIVSHPHFYRADDKYLTMVDGLSPEADKHSIYLYFEPFTGSPVAAYKRVQFNIFIHPVEKVKIMKKFPDALLPLFWIEEGVILPDDLVKQIKDGLKAVKMVKYFKWLLVLSGLGMAVFAAARHFQLQSQTKNINT